MTGTERLHYVGIALLRILSETSISLPHAILAPRSYDAFHQATPWRPVGGGESASCVADRGYYGPNNGTTGHVGSGASFFACVAEAWSEAATRDFVFGAYVHACMRAAACGS
jgi:hypothetical protein